MEILELPPEYHLTELAERTWTTCGFRITLERKKTQIFFQVYLTSTLLVILAWVAFLISPDAIPRRMDLLLTVFLTLINIFIGARRNSPTTSGFLNAVDIFLVVCIGEVFIAVLEYALVLYMFDQDGKLALSPLSVSKQRSVSTESESASKTNDNFGNAAKGWQNNSNMS